METSVNDFPALRDLDALLRAIASTIAYLAILTVTCLVLRFRLKIPVADLFLMRPSDIGFLRTLFLKPAP